MRIQCDSLKYAKILEQKGIKSSDADGFMSTLTEIDIFNLYSQQEVNNMLSESIKEIFIEFDEKLEKHSEKFNETMRKSDEKFEKQNENFNKALLKNDENFNKALLKNYEKFDKALLKNDEKFDKESMKHELKYVEQRAELLSSRRWLVGTIITVGFSLAAYLSALIKIYSH